MKDKFNELIIGSGGLSGLSYLGSLEILDTYYPINKFKYLTGCSAGACICCLINIDYNVKEMQDIVLNLNFSDFFEIKLSNMINNSGFVDSINLKNLLKSMFLTKNIHSNITFIELYNLTQKILTVNSVNQTKNQIKYFNYINTPNMFVIDAVLMSMNIPLIFCPIKYNGDIYYDGALLEPYPYKYIKNTNKLGLIVFTNYLNKFILKEESNNFMTDINDSRFDENNPLNNFLNTIFLLYNNYLKFFYKKRIKNTIYLICDFESNVNMNNEQKISIIEKGYDKTHLFFKKKIKKLKKEFLLKKYFYLLKYLVFH